MSTLVEPMAKQPTGEVSVKLKAAVYRLVKTVASYRGEKVSDYLSSLVEPLVRREWEKIHREVAKEADDAD